MMSPNQFKLIATKLFVKPSYQQRASLSTAGKVKLYGFQLSQPTRSIMMLLEQNSIAYDFEFVDVFKGQARTKEFKSIHPAGLVPVINDNGFILGESAAILQYVSEKHNSNLWYPSQDLKKKSLINFWLHWHHHNTRISTKEILTPHLFPKLMKEEKVISAKKSFTRSLQYMEDTLKTSKFLVTDEHPTIADLLIITEIDQLGTEAFELFDLTPFPTVLNWMKLMETHVKSYRRIFQPVIKIAKELKEKNSN